VQEAAEGRPALFQRHRVALQAIAVRRVGDDQLGPRRRHELGGVALVHFDPPGEAGGGERLLRDGDGARVPVVAADRRQFAGAALRPRLGVVEQLALRIDVDVLPALEREAAAEARRAVGRQPRRLDEEAKHVSKAVVDTAVMRFGDLLGACANEGLRAAQLGNAGLCAAALPVLVLWAWLGRWLGRACGRIDGAPGRRLAGGAATARKIPDSC
jgi:hypothetical protein